MNSKLNGHLGNYLYQSGTMDYVEITKELSYLTKPERLEVINFLKSSDIRKRNVLTRTKADKLIEFLEDIDCKNIEIVKEEKQQLKESSILDYIKPRINMDYMKEEEGYKYLDSRTLLFIDFENIMTDVEEINRLGKYFDVFVIMHKVGCMTAHIPNMDLNNVNVVVIDDDRKQVADMKIYSMVYTAYLLGFTNLAIISKDKGFQTFCNVNDIPCAIISNYKIRPKYMQINRRDFSDLSNIKRISPSYHFPSIEDKCYEHLKNNDYVIDRRIVDSVSSYNLQGLVTDSLYDSLQIATEYISEMEPNMNKYKEQSNKYKESLSTLRGEFNALVAEHGDLVSENESLLKEIERLRKENEVVQDLLRRKLSTVTDELNKCKEEKQELLYNGIAIKKMLKHLFESKALNKEYSIESKALNIEPSIESKALNIEPSIESKPSKEDTNLSTIMELSDKYDFLKDILNLSLNDILNKVKKSDLTKLSIDCNLNIKNKKEEIIDDLKYYLLNNK